MASEVRLSWVGRRAGSNPRPIIYQPAQRGNARSCPKMPASQVDWLFKRSAGITITVKGPTTRSDPFGVARFSAGRPPELHANLRRLRPVVHIDDWIDLKYVEGGELASAVPERCRIVGLHYGEPSFAVDSPDELVER